ncbi:MAG TPA: hypothetical protein PKD90_00665 [Phnomibacter sp.]|nr:hypothetical protein [Phnomibacter sp.]
MREGSKIVFSAAELSLLGNASLLLTKNTAIGKICQLFGHLAAHYEQQWQPWRHGYPEVFGARPKISKGEQYEGLPWVMLDYPRYFNQQEGHFAVRTFFWWGHGYSMRLHLSGRFLNLLSRNFGWLQQAVDMGWQTGLTPNPWDNAVGATHWEPPTLEGLNRPGAYLILAKKMPLTQGLLVMQYCNEWLAELRGLLSAGLVTQPVE